MIQKIDFYWWYEGTNFSLFTFSLFELQKQLKDIYGITLFNNNYNLN
jgi:hypothetical protein